MTGEYERQHEERRLEQAEHDQARHLECVRVTVTAERMCNIRMANLLNTLATFDLDGGALPRCGACEEFQRMAKAILADRPPVERTETTVEPELTVDEAVERLCVCDSCPLLIKAECEAADSAGVVLDLAAAVERLIPIADAPMLLSRCDRQPTIDAAHAALESAKKLTTNQPERKCDETDLE